MDFFSVDMYLLKVNKLRNLFKINTEDTEAMWSDVVLVLLLQTLNKYMLAEYIGNVYLLKDSNKDIRAVYWIMFKVNDNIH